MDFKIIGTGSGGNCYLFTEEGRSLVIEAGMPLKDLNLAIKGLTRNVEAVLISHEHGDHSKFARQYKTAGLKCFASAGTSETTGIDFTPLHPLQAHTFGPFQVVPFAVTHNAAQPLGFAIWTKSAGLTIFATDLSEAPDLEIDTPHNILIEANYCQDLYFQKCMSMGEPIGTKHHLSVQQAAEWANQFDTIHVQKIVLLHGSARLSDTDQRMKSHFEHKAVSVGRNGELYRLFDFPF